jgi:hypothetical protein
VTLDGTPAREQADVVFLDEHAEAIVYLDDSDEEIHREYIGSLVNKDGLLTSDRCPRCTALVACQRCKDLVEVARDDGLDAVDLDEERGLVA